MLSAVPSPERIALNRMAFGARPGDEDRVRTMGLAAYVEEQLRPPPASDPLTQARLARTTLNITYGAGAKYPAVLKSVRGLGLMIGIELAPDMPAFQSSGMTAAAGTVRRLHQAGLLAIPAGSQVIRLLPPLNLARGEAREGLQIFESVVASLNS